MSSLVASATDYYISSTGNDAANGLSSSTAWKTIAKINSGFSAFKPGDRILFNRGDTFNGTLNISKSGSIGNPITVGAYGTGADPVINGFVTITGWTNVGGGIYSKVVSCESTPIMVTVDGENTGMGRFPNKGWMTIDSHNSNLSLTNADLNSTITDWKGAEVAIRVNYYTINHLPITNHTDRTLTFSTGSVYNLIDGYGFFIQNDLRTLDEYKEWYYNASTSTFYMYFGSEVPANHTIRVSIINNACNISNQSYITFDNLSFQGFNNNTFTLNTTPHITIQNCSISFCGGNAIDGVGGQAGTSSYFVFNNNTINDINNNGLILKDQFTNVTISNNKISNVGLISGTGYPKLIATHTGIYIGYGATGNTSTVIEYNNISNIGYSAIDFAGTNVTVRFNYINGFCLERDDGGGIYTYDNVTNDSNACNVLNNIVLNGIGDLSGTPSGSGHCVAGIYCDGYSNGITITGNTVANCSHAGYLGNSNTNGVITDNTFYNNEVQIYLDCISYSNGQNNIQLKRNIAFCKTENQLSLLYTAYSELTSTANLDDNYYVRPIDDNDVINNWIYPGKEVYYSIAQWQSHSGQDANSHKSPITIADTNKIRFEYNASNSNKEIALGGDYIDIKGTKYSGSITLLPYTSAVLMLDPNPSAPPSSPVYVSSAIENVTPSVLEMVYNLSLTGIVPAASAFTVQVNSVTRPVNEVVVSGTNVLLTLASPVVNGNVVTVTYIKPSANPLQTASGGLASSISNQAVINNCINIAPAVAITSPIMNSSFSSPANITITASASDTDGSVSLVEFYNGSTKIGSKTTAPYSFTWNNVAAGIYSLTVVATDNLNVKTISSAISISVINSTNTVNQPPFVEISNPLKGNMYITNSTITIDAVATDPDGTIIKVEFYSGKTKLVELTSPPYSYTWKDVTPGTYSITAVATDNLNATTTSSAIEFEVVSNTKYDANSKILNLYPNPNDGHFSIEFIIPLQNEKNEVIITDLAGKQVYVDTLSNEETSKQFDLSYIKSGIYIMMIICKEILVTKKFIKN
ncbi:MAG: Ig-like domain-containing protein [Bacteroidales bacterium]